tara:strand:- start:70 stop:1200 length:1131 start_codon:yes stop_codon:yes gene_type:complete
MPFIGTQPEVGGYSVLDALTASATANYTLQLNSANFTPNSANSLLVSLNGVIQKPGSSFTVSGSTLSFSSALTSSDSIDFIIAMGEPLLIGTPSDNTVTTSKLATNAVSTAKISDDAVTGAKIENNPTIAGNLTVSGTATLAGNSTVGGTLGVTGNSTVGGTLGVTGATSLAGTTVSSSTLNMLSSPIQFAGNVSLPNVGACIFRPVADTIAFGINNGQRVSVNQHGLLFGTDTSASNALDDYEEGTFTATLVATGSTFQYTYRTGAYTKIGNCVNFNLYIQLDGGGNSFVGNAVTITGLPFTSRTPANDNYRYYVHGRYLNVDGANYYYVTANLANGSSGLSLNMGGDNVPNSALPATYLSSSSGQLFINGWYHT